MSEPAEPYDLIGVGIDSFNASLAALAEPLSDLRVLFLEAKSRLAWNVGLRTEEVRACIPLLGDLVTLVDPTSRWSFVSYLRANNLLFPFLSLRRTHISRQEYEHYCRWVVGSLPPCVFGRSVQSVRWDAEDRLFHVEHMDSCGRKTVERAANVVLGAGAAPVATPPSGQGAATADVFLKRSWERPERDSPHHVNADNAQPQKGGNVPIPEQWRHGKSSGFDETITEIYDSCAIDRIVLERGDMPTSPAFLDPLVSFIEWDSPGRYAVDSHFRVALTPQISGSLFVHKAEIDIPGPGVFNLGLAAWRSATIINALLGRDQYGLSDLHGAYNPVSPVGAL
ncbi:SidA/IucD/PvdA family monooxygenase [Streptomyces sp. NPDC007205]|uniref:SidA/IucD/PvdA family monooxygenase n=1 Tax=Streptomyces sp. NPDC007205 TaxID=3154316 RepID=UPI0034062D4C